MQLTKIIKMENFGIWFTVFTLAITAVFLVFAAREPHIRINDKQVKISGLYGENIPKEDIQEVLLLNEIPPISIRTNGLGLGRIKKGYFKMKNIGIVKLFLRSNKAPYILIKTKKRQFYINFKDPNETKNLYNQIIEVLW